MNGADLPYQLRPNKFIDRQIFVDLLSRLISPIGNERYVYISMGGKHVVDHNVVYERLGIPYLFSFDRDRDVVKRQTYNKPIQAAVCVEMDSGGLPAAIDEIFNRFEQASNLIVWLDYTSAKDRRTQVQEMSEVLRRFRSQDVLRITMNASLGTLEKASDEWRSLGYESPAAFRLERLRSQLGEYVPSELNGISDQDFPVVLAQCLHLAVSRVEAERSDLSFQPRLLTTYRDGQRMFTLTVQAVETVEAKTLPRNLETWPFLAMRWSDIVAIESPDLSTKEKLFIDQHLDHAPSDILRRLGFDLSESHVRSLSAVRSYKRLHRYYPEFRNVEF